MSDAPERFRLLASNPPKQGKSSFAAMATSLLVHAGIAALLVWATMAVGEEVADEDEVVTLVEVVDEVIPPPPPPPPEMEPPPPEMADVPQGFQTLSTPTIIPPDIPPPGEEISEADFSGEGAEGGRAEGQGPPVPGTGEVSNVFAFTPYTVKPRCQSRCDAEDILGHVPPLLKRSGVSCTLTVGIRIDTGGAVTATDVLRSSGNSSCDQAAQAWARTTRWTTAYNRDQAVTVWIAQPLTITTE
jgi:periplasmic protein TonB